MAHPVYSIDYKEGIFVGYRWYEAKKIQPLYAFGHGLSYSKFEYSELKISPAVIRPADRVTVEFKVTNTSTVEGAEVTQLYVHDAKVSVPRPGKELKGFSKIMLKPGESRVVRIRVTGRDLGFWDVQQHAWKTEPGEFRILVGGASDHIALQGGFSVE
jgi:beta-glucosidase